MIQKLERLSVDPDDPLGIVMECNLDTKIGKVSDPMLSAEENSTNVKRLVDAWNALVAAAGSQS